MLKSTLAVLALVLIAAFASQKNADAAVISVGAFPELNPAPAIAIPAGTFLLPVEISGAANLQFWQFDLLFDNTVVEVVDPFDGSSGIYGAEFTPGAPNTLSFILGGFPLNFLGLVDDVAGEYPGLLNGVTGDGVLAYILFGFIIGQEANNPSFAIANPSVTEQPGGGGQVPEPSILFLLAGALFVLAVAKARHS
jgi:hypothetical protein